MTTFCSSKRTSTIARFAVLLIVAALAIAATACDGSRTYQLSISSTSGGSVTVPGEGAFTYDAGAVVELVATAADGYQFDGWTGDTQDIAEPGSHAITITMNGDYSITANFDPRGTPDPSKP
jgi:uncharacterized repeat protein (TIGR02543 family)